MQLLTEINNGYLVNRLTYTTLYQGKEGLVDIQNNKSRQMKRFRLMTIFLEANKDSNMEKEYKTISACTLSGQFSQSGDKMGIEIYWYQKFVVLELTLVKDFDFLTFREV